MHRLLVRVSIGVLTVSVISVGGLAAYGLAARSNPTAFFPSWFRSPSDGTAQSLGPPPAPGVRPIIFLPGIMGSYLQDSSGKETWPLADKLTNCGLAFHDTSCVQRLLTPDALPTSGVPADGSAVDPADSGAGPLLGGALSVTDEDWNGFGAHQDWYDITAENAQNAGYSIVQPGDTTALSACAPTKRCFIPVGVDWRLSAITNAQSVLRVIDKVIAATGTDRVDILAHSQGGLIAEALAHEQTSVGKLYRVVTLGTPYLGAPKMLSELLYGEPCQFPYSHAFGLLSGCLIDPSVIQRLAENFPGAADLSPSAAYFQAYPVADSPLLPPGVSSQGLDYAATQAVIAQTLARPPSGSGLVPRDPTLMAAAQTFHGQVDHWAPRDPYLSLLRMVGYDGDTATRPCQQPPCTSLDGLGTYNRTSTIIGDTTGGGHLRTGTGDGTVPLFSANLYDPATNFDDRGTGHDLYWCGLSHFGLTWSTPVWQATQSFLEGAANYTSDELGAACPDGTLGSLQGLGLLPTSVSPAVIPTSQALPTASALTPTASPTLVIPYTPPASASATPTYMTCQLSVTGKDAYITVGGQGVSGNDCVNLSQYLHHNQWYLVSDPPSSLPTTGVRCSVPSSLLPQGDSGVVTDYGSFSTNTGDNACRDMGAPVS